ncbi:phage virion morphogenesis protein [Serratia entomophila]|uniref:phage virion morphogenesis protein n=1 Tax=Serratia entomophila TaxID=42906 RepID=UPI002179579C|nr:phage virion morphogenesis protein [Serratia entomophila]CAI1077588.1 phage virion morphogenesis protein [Serratia entomophila]CAI1742378.1 phage virion morphogenesis protein [Serratia entomophila]CAI1762805.1 phage virion morphogenesis protein [Serratia entomophila]CAI1808823.1 phage virion morphogenesis protein [Serratia entomophila]CAI1853849.1 phage virion morphogenesis protein [Serratia entomophila]
MSEFSLFDARLAGLIAKLSPQSRKSLAVAVSKRLRAGQQQHIKRQQAPDGTPYAPRKTRLRNKKRLRDRAMFSKLRTARYLKAQGNSDAAVVEFVGRVKRMVNVHHYGLRDRPSPHSADVKYEARSLLGFSPADVKMIEKIIISNLNL